VASTTQQYVNWFRHSSPYINQHKGKTFVLLIGGDAIAHPNFANIIHDIALLNSLGVRLVLSFGIRPQIENKLVQAGIESSYHNNLRITDSAMLEHVVETAGAQRTQIEALLSMGVANSPMHGANIHVCSGNFITAKPLGVQDGVDFQHTGEVRRIDWPAIAHQLAHGSVVLLPPLGYSPTGEIFNLSKEDVAIHTALALQADKLIVLDQSAGLLDKDGNLIRELCLSDAREKLQQHDDAGLSTNFEVALTACQSGISRCHLVSYTEDGALIQELFTRDGCGTMVVQDSYELSRPADIEDVGGILALIEPLEADGTLVHRSREILETEIDHFTVIERDGMIIGCAAIYPATNNDSAELACLVTHPSYRKNDRGQRLLDSICSDARQCGIKSLFVLTTRTAHWFQERGFIAGEIDQLPGEKKSLYNYQRNSKVFIKTL
jgi:amino-acid N-acetyltransferase